jgi:hypothetical protein
MNRTIFNIHRVNPNFAICNFTDGSRFELRGDESHVDRRVALVLETGTVPERQDIATSVANLEQFVAKLDSLPPPNARSPFKVDDSGNEDPNEMMMPTINWQTGQIERNGEPIRERSMMRESPPLLFMLNQQSGIVANAGIEEHDTPYVMPTMDFSERLITHQLAKPVEYQNGSRTILVANGGDENDAPYVMPTMDFSERR